MSELTKTSMMSVYPEVLDKDFIFNALGQSAAEAIGEAFIASEDSGIYTRIDQLNDMMLDVLAQDFNISWYDKSFSLEVKRRVIAAAFATHRRMGTKGALLTAIRAIWPSTLVEEWYQYGGDPYYFRIRIGAESDLNPVQLESLKKTILLYKNERSWLEDGWIIFGFYCGITVHTSTDGQKYSTLVCGSVLCGTEPRQYTYVDPGQGPIVQSSAGYSSYSPRLCGTPLNALM